MTIKGHTRRVHYFGGFDPRGAGWYYRLCRDEAARAQPGGVNLRVSRREKQGDWASVWTVEAEMADSKRAAHTEHVFMGWDDIIRDHWPRHWGALLLGMVGAYLSPTARVVLPHLARLHRGAFWAGLLPALLVILGVFLAVLTGGAMVNVLPDAWGWVASILVGGGVLWSFGRLYVRLRMDWLLRIYLFVLRLGGRPMVDLAQRQMQWVEDVIARQKADPADEVVLVGHSVGTLVMLSAVDALLGDARWQTLQQGRPTLMVTLGQCMPFVAQAPHAKAFRAVLSRLCWHPGLRWCDVTARIDPLCFHMVHPLRGTGQSMEGARGPYMLSARFFQMYEPQRWRRIRRDKLMTHFLYLMAPDKPGNFHFYEWLYGVGPTYELMPGVLFDKRK